MNKPNTGYKFNLSYKRELTKDALYNEYKSDAIKTNLLEVGYIAGSGLSNTGTGFSYLGTAASVTVGPEVGAPLIAIGSAT